MDVSNAILILTSLISLTLGVIVLFVNPKKVANISFFTFCLSLTGWVMGNFFIDFFKSYELSLFFTKITAISVDGIGISLLVFTSYFPNSLNYKKIIFYLVGILSLFFALISFPTDLIVQSVNVDVFPVSVTHGGLYIYFIVLVLISLIVSFYNIFKQFKISKGNQKIQAKYFLFALLTSIPIAIFTNLILPAIGVTFLTRIGPSAMLFLISIVYIAVIRHRFFDIKYFISNLLSKFLLICYVNTVFFLTINLEQAIYGTVFASELYILDGFVSIFFTLVFIYLYNKFLVFTRKYSGVEKQNEVINEIRKITSSKLDVHESLDKIIYFFKSVIEVDKIHIILKGNDDTFTYCNDTVLCPLIEEKTNFERICKLEINPYILSEQKSENKTEFPYEIYTKNNVGLSMHIDIDEETNVAFFVQSPDIDNKAFLVSEVTFLETVFKEIALFLNRSMLHQKVVDFNKTLQDKIDLATKEVLDKNKALEKAYGDLEETARQERDMLDIMGHELRTPATVVKMAVYIEKNELTKPTPDAIKIKENVERIRESIERQITLINTFINTAKLDNNKFEIKKSPFIIEEVVKKAIDDLRPQALDKGLEMNYLDNNLQTQVNADMARIREVMDNLLTNAIKYTDKGSIKASCKIDAEHNNIIISIEDTGEGIKAEEKEELFQKFKRLHNYTTSSGVTNSQIVRPGGTGLGLYVTKGIVELHGGKIWVDSIYGQGSTFSFSLPIDLNINQDKPQNNTNNTQSDSMDLFKKLGLKK